MNKTLALSMIALAGYMVTIFYLSSLPGNLPPGVEAIEIPRIMMHVGEYAVLGFLMNSAFIQVYNKNLKSILSSSVFSSLYGVTDEAHQYFVPTRCFDVYDICADTIGGMMGAVFFVVVLLILKQIKGSR
jgi:VanZ family protein